MKPVWRLLLLALEHREGLGRFDPHTVLTANERGLLIWLRAWRRREREERG